MTNDPLINALLRAWATQRDYAARLVADLSDDDMVSQPVRGGVTMNHPAWILGHLSAYSPVLARILRLEPFEDPLKHRYGRETRPTGHRADYPSKHVLLADFLAGHDDLAATLARTDLSVLARPIPLARWEPRFPLIADAIVYLMLNHESTHLGQISAWRRAGGRPAV